MGESNFTNNALCVSVFEKPQLKVADTDASFFSWSVKSFEQPRAVFGPDKEVFRFMSQGKFHFVPDVAYGIEDIQKAR